MWRRAMYRLKYPELTEWLAVGKDLEARSAAEVMEWQRARLKESLRAAVEKVEFYRARSAQYRLPEALDGGDLSGLPTLSKDDLRAHARSFVPAGLSVCEVLTSGSTGRPLRFYRSREATAAGIAAMIRARGWFGVDFFARSALYIEHGEKMRRGAAARAALALRPLVERVKNRAFFSAYDMSPTTLDRHLETVRRFKPTYINGYATSLYLLACRAEAVGLDPSEVSLRAAFPTSETLYPWQRDVIGRAFDIAVGGEYGMVEGGIIAHECPSGTYHTMDDRVYVELLPTEKENVREIVITTLVANDIPLIRYRTGDVVEGKRPACPCGVGLNTIPPVLGRSHDLLYGAQGEVVHGQACTHAVNHAGSIRRFQVVQAEKGHLRVIVEPEPGFSDITRARITDGLKAVFGGNVTVDVDITSAIQSTKAGKFRWIVSELAADPHVGRPTGVGS